MNGEKHRRQAAPFSKNYAIVPGARVMKVPDAHAQMDIELFQFLQRHFGENFIGKVGGLHYQFQSTRSVPSDAVIVPEQSHDNPETFLVCR